MEIYYKISSEKSVCNMSFISHLSRIYIHLALYSTDIGEKAASKTRVTPISGLKESLQKSFWSYCCPNQQKALWDKRGKAVKNLFFNYIRQTILYYFQVYTIVDRHLYKLRSDHCNKSSISWGKALYPDVEDP